MHEWNFPAPGGSGAVDHLVAAAPTLRGVLDRIITARAENANHRDWCDLVITVAPHLPNGVTVYEQDGSGRVRWVSTTTSPTAARPDATDRAAGL